MKVLVTGLSGFTGQYVQRELVSAGYDVAGLKGDLLDTSHLETQVKLLQPDAVIHLAAIAFVAHSDLQQIYDVNIVGTRNLLSVLAKNCSNLQSIVLASSANVYGNNDKGVLNESMPVNPANDYAVSKVAMEYMARTWLDRLPIILARPFNYTGTGQHENFLIPKIVSHFKRKESVIELGNLDVARDFSDVRDVALAYRCLLEKGVAGSTYNISSGIATSLDELIDMCRGITSSEIQIKVNSQFVRDNEIKLLVGDCTALAHATGFASRFSIRETLEWMF